MRKETEIEEDELRPEYDLSQLKGRVRRKYVERYQVEANLIRFEPSVENSVGRKNQLDDWSARILACKRAEGE
jgi:hypothetical protein